jgi:hypothetical protein
LSIAEGDFGKPNATFSDGSILSLNKTATLALAKVYGWDSSGWTGRSIEIFEGEVMVKGTPKPAIAVRPLDAKAEAAASPRVTAVPTRPRAGGDMDDELPF